MRFGCLLITLFLFSSPAIPLVAAGKESQCSVDAEGLETCVEVPTLDDFSSFDPSQKVDGSAFEEPDPIDDMNTSVEDGGLMVVGPVCEDILSDCVELVWGPNDDDDDEAGTETEFCNTEENKEKCPVSCEKCERSVGLVTTIGERQEIAGTFDEVAITTSVVTEMIRYLKEEVLVEYGYSVMYKECINKHEMCAFWAGVGECTNNAAFMTESCMLSCKKCDDHPRYLRVHKL